MTYGTKWCAGMLVLAVAALGLPGQASAVGYTRIGETNEFLENELGRFSFSLSLLPNDDQPGGRRPTAPNIGLDKGADAYVLAFSGAYQFQGAGSGDTVFGGTAIGNSLSGGVPISAPVTASGAAYADPYMATSGGGYALVAAYTTSARASYIAARGISLLWGSVEADNELQILGITSPSARIYGSDILAAAASLGIAGGNAGSYYVTINDRRAAGSSMYGVYGKSGRSTFEYVLLELSTSNIAAMPTGAPSTAPGSGGTPEGAPAPVLGATPAGGIIALGLLGSLGLRRSRRLVRAGA